MGNVRRTESKHDNYYFTPTESTPLLNPQEKKIIGTQKKSLSYLNRFGQYINIRISHLRTDNFYVRKFDEISDKLIHSIKSRFFNSPNPVNDYQDIDSISSDQTFRQELDAHFRPIFAERAKKEKRTKYRREMLGGIPYRMSITLARALSVVSEKLHRYQFKARLRNERIRAYRLLRQFTQTLFSSKTAEVSKADKSSQQRKKDF